VNKGVRVDFLPEKYPKVGRRVHKFVLNPANPSALYHQNHCGMHISKNGEDIWEEVPEGLLSTFGFSVIASPRHPDTVFWAPSSATITGYTPRVAWRCTVASTAVRPGKLAATGCHKHLMLIFFVRD
jgi:hypothetical protein